MGGTKYKLFQVHVIPFELRGLTIWRVIWNPRPLLKHRIWRHHVNNQTIIIQFAIVLHCVESAR